MEPLHAAPWRAVIVHQGLDRPVARTEPFRQTRRVIAGNRQPAAFCRAIRREGADDGMATGSKSPVDEPQIGLLIVKVGQEVERGPVTHITDRDKLATLLVVVALAVTWAYRCATLAMGRKAIRRKCHGRREKSWFRTGFDALRNWIIDQPDKALDAGAKSCPQRPLKTIRLA